MALLLPAGNLQLVQGADAGRVVVLVMTITQTTQVGSDFQALITADAQLDLLRAVDMLKSRYADLCLEPMDEPAEGMDQRWSVILRPTVELF